MASNISLPFGGEDKFDFLAFEGGQYLALITPRHRGKALRVLGFSPVVEDLYQIAFENNWFGASLVARYGVRIVDLPCRETGEMECFFEIAPNGPGVLPFLKRGIIEQASHRQMRFGPGVYARLKKPGDVVEDVPVKIESAVCEELLGAKPEVLVPQVDEDFGGFKYALVEKQVVQDSPIVHVERCVDGTECERGKGVSYLSLFERRVANEVACVLGEAPLVTDVAKAVIAAARVGKLCSNAKVTLCSDGVRASSSSASVTVDVILSCLLSYERRSPGCRFALDGNPGWKKNLCREDWHDHDADSGCGFVASGGPDWKDFGCVGLHVDYGANQRVVTEAPVINVPAAVGGTVLAARYELGSDHGEYTYRATGVGWFLARFHAVDGLPPELSVQAEAIRVVFPLGVRVEVAGVVVDTDVAPLIVIGFGRVTIRLLSGFHLVDSLPVNVGQRRELERWSVRFLNSRTNGVWARFWTAQGGGLALGSFGLSGCSDVANFTVIRGLINKVSDDDGVTCGMSEETLEMGAETLLKLRVPWNGLMLRCKLGKVEVREEGGNRVSLEDGVSLMISSAVCALDVCNAQMAEVSVSRVTDEYTLDDGGPSGGEDFVDEY